MDVHLLARGAHLDALRRSGLTVRTPEEEWQVRVPASDDPAVVGPVDVVLFCVKSYDTDEAAAGLGPLVGEGTAVISLQNGIDNEERIAGAIGWDHVMGGAAYMLGAIEEPGVVRAGGPRRIEFGEWDGRRTERAERFLSTCRSAGIAADIPPDIRVALWSKYAFLVGISAMTAAVRLPVGELRASPAAWAMYRAMVEEVWRIARASGVALPDDLVERTVAFAEGLAPDSYSSLHHDLVTGHRMELDALQGTAIRLARELGIGVPWLAAAHAILEPWARRNAGGGGTG